MRGETVHEGDRRVAQEERRARDKAWALSMRQPPRGYSYPKWNRACRDARRRTQVHTPAPSGQKPWDRWVVYIVIGADKRVKIGHSQCLPRRLCEFRYFGTGGLRPIRLVKAIECEGATTVEARAHKLLKRMGLWDDGEWFFTTPSVASRVLNQAIRQLEEDAAKYELRKIKGENGRFSETRAYRLWKKRPKKD